MSTTTYEYVAAFERNCPGVRMNADEREELRRLFAVYARDQREKLATPFALAAIQAVYLGKTGEPLSLECAAAIAGVFTGEAAP